MRSDSEKIIYTRKAFTLIELLIVIAILAVLGAALVVVLNPTELIAQSRDSQRFNDIASIDKALSLFTFENSGLLGSTNIVYISLPDDGVGGSTCTNLASLPPLPSGWSYHCVTSANLRKTDGSGWLPIAFSSITQGPPLASLPIDPSALSSPPRYYAFIIGADGKTYKTQSSVESIRYGVLAGKDGGIDPTAFEKGTAISEAPFINGLSGFWKFEEGGATVSDYSGFGHPGTWYGTGTHYVLGKSGNSGQFNGVDDYVLATPSPSNSFTVISLIKPNQLNREQHISEWSATQFYLGSSNRLGTSAWSTAQGSTTLSLGTWYNVAITRDTQGVKLYLDGALNGSGSAAGGPGAAFNIGDFYNHTGSYKFNGLIDEVMFYNRVLSPGEIAAVYNYYK